MSRAGKILLAGVAVLALAGGAGAGWYVWLRPHDRLALARSLMAKGDARSAQLALRSAVMADPDNAEAHFRLGEVQLRLGDPVKAERELSLAHQHGWDAHAIAPQLASSVLAQGRDKDVLATFKADGLAPEQAAAVLVVRSTAYLRLRQPASAHEAAIEAEKLAPRKLDPVMAEATASLASGDGVGAEQAVDRALAIDAHAPVALLMKAELRSAQDDQKGTLASLDAALAAAPDFQPARLARARLLTADHQDERARVDVAELLRREPRSPFGNLLQAQLLLRAHDAAGADAALDRVGTDLPKLPRGEMVLAITKAGLGQPEQAIDAASRYLGHTPDDPAAYKLLASLDLTAHRFGDAAAVLARAIASGNADAETFDLLGQAEAQNGRVQGALQAMQQAAALAPKNPAILARLASLRLGTVDANHADRDLQHLLDVQLTAGGAATAQAAPGPVMAALQAGDTDRAAAALQKLRANGAPLVQLETLDGLVKLAQLDFPEAQAAFESVLRADPNSVQARTDLAGALSLQGQEDKAEPLLRQVLNQEPANLPALSALQRLLAGSGRGDAILPMLDAAHSAAQGNPRITAALADTYVAAGQPNRALGLLDGAFATPSGADAQNGSLLLLGARVRAELALGQRIEAAATLRQILAAQPRNAALRRQVIDLLLAQHDFAGARAMVDEGLAAQPGEPALLGADVLVASKAGGLQAGLDRADTLARNPANQPTARLLRGEVYFEAGQYSQAEAAFTAALSDDAPTAVVMGGVRAALAQGKPDHAADLLRTWVQKHPDDNEAGLALATLDIGAQHLEEAHAGLQAVLTKQPNNAAALNNLAIVEQQQQHLPQARNLAQRAWLLSSTPAAADTLGWILLSSGDPAAKQGGTALDLLRLAAHSLPNDPGVQYHYAVALKDRGERDQAAAILRKLVPPAASFGEQSQARKLLDALSSG